VAVRGRSGDEMWQVALETRCGAGAAGPCVSRSNMDGYYRYYICFRIFYQIWIRIQIVSTMSDKIQLDVDIINIRFKYSDTNTVSDVEHSDSHTD